MQAIPDLRHRGVYPRGTARRCRSRRLLPQRGSCVGRGHKVRLQHSIDPHIFIRCRRYLVYNLRKRGGDSADKYFKSTEMIAGVKDMRFQALMPDVLHWLGIKKIDNMVSMSDMCALFMFLGRNLAY